MAANFWLIGAIAAVIIARRINRIAGGMVGIAIAVAVGAWGVYAYGDGGGMALFGLRLPLPVFLGFVALWCALEAFGVWQAISRRRSRAESDAE
jgi:hypothetical protein